MNVDKSKKTYTYPVTEYTTLSYNFPDYRVATLEEQTNWKDTYKILYINLDYAPFVGWKYEDPFLNDKALINLFNSGWLIKEDNRVRWNNLEDISPTNTKILNILFYKITSVTSNTL